MDEIFWRIRWSPMLAPDLAIIPTKSVFWPTTRTQREPSLTATVAGAWSLLMEEEHWEQLLERLHQECDGAG
jgi:hypothetical protein